MILDPATLANLRKTQEAYMMDVCVIYRLDYRERNTRGETVKTFAEGVESICGVQMSPEGSVTGDSYRTADIDVILRLPHGVEVKPDDEIEIIVRPGETVTPQRYVVDRYTNVGPSGGRAYLKAKKVL